MWQLSIGQRCVEWYMEKKNAFYRETELKKIFPNIVIEVDEWKGLASENNRIAYNDKVGHDVVLKGQIFSNAEILKYCLLD